MKIEFVPPTFNRFTLELPPFKYRVPYDSAEYHTACDARSMAQADLRKAKRTRDRLQAYISGGWSIEFEPHQHLGLQTSKRGEQRRAQLGRA